MKSSNNGLFEDAMRRLAALRKTRSIPMVRQMAATDCGPACLAMVLGFYGKSLRLHEVRTKLPTGRDGADAESIVRAGRAFGLRSRGVTIDISELDNLPTASIIYWGFRHFVVFERVYKATVHIVDPARGRRAIPIREFRRYFTGVALLMEPTPDFNKQVPERKQRLGWFSLMMNCRELIVRVMTTSLMTQLVLALIPLLTGLVVDQVLPHSDTSLLIELFGGFCLFQLFSIIATFVRAHLFIHLKTQLETIFTLHFLDHLVDLPYAFFQQHTTGDLMVRLGSNNAIRETLTSAVLSTLMDGIMATVYCLLLFFASSKLALAALCLAGIRFLLLAIMRWRQRILLNETLDNQSSIQTYQTEMLAGMETLKAMGLEKRAQESWTDYFVDGLNIKIRRGKLDAMFTGILSIVGASTAAIFLFYSGYLVIHAQMSLGMMFAVGSLAGGLLSPLNSLAMTLLELQMVEVYIERITDVMNTAPEQDDDKRALFVDVMGSLEISHLSFRYAGNGPEVLGDVSFSIAPKSRVALVGTSGCGKSTLVRLLAGLYEPTEGSICFDGKDLSTLDKRSVRSHIGVVTQDVQLFGGSIRRNIALSKPDMSLASVVAAAKAACIHEDISKMPMGYETILTDRGLSLSGGQRQRLALARALASDPSVLILDEATSHLDAVTEQLVHQSLNQLRCTQIVVAHRLSTIRNADNIIVMSKGRVVETGSHNDLITARGPYSELVAAQGDQPSINIGVPASNTVGAGTAGSVRSANVSTPSQADMVNARFNRVF